MSYSAVISRFFVLLLVLAGTAGLRAQAPGYMGKRFHAGYGIYASPGFLGSGGLTYVNLAHEGFVEFATSRKFSLGLSARFYNAVEKNETSVSSSALVNGFYQEYSGVPEGMIQLKGRNYMLYGKFFKRNYVAPWGRYFLLGAALRTYRASYDPDQMYLPTSYYGDQYYYNDFGPTTQSYVNFDVMFGNGRSRVIADRITLDYGYNIYLWSATSMLLNYSGVLEGNRVAGSEYVQKNASRRMREVNAFNLFLKVGFLF